MNDSAAELGPSAQTWYSDLVIIIITLIEDIPHYHSPDTFFIVDTNIDRLRVSKSLFPRDQLIQEIQRTIKFPLHTSQEKQLLLISSLLDQAIEFYIHKWEINTNKFVAWWAQQYLKHIHHFPSTNQFEELCTLIFTFIPLQQLLQKNFTKAAKIMNKILGLDLDPLLPGDDE